MSDFSGKSDDGKLETDLFGAPIGQIKERWGRPSFAKSKENQELVALLKAANWTVSRIARHLGCDEKTLRKHFSRELEQGADIIEAMALQVTLQKMRQGNSVATGRILDITEKANLTIPPAKPKSATDDERPGKKEQANIDAQTAHQDSEWGTILQ
ncbi:helix-turn-helix domain-containing protein [Brucella anthropi]|uniref:helix-turn-helix domain-containing protein n=1 Tax=Brucella anthropi TaxID=529 RepID=UPI00124DBFA6|nr:helix-turn-helix domain-containing protein [Brucella anthropi]KAB2781254.1 AraC family transcriptional regulator [Brucella anthropi]